MAKPLGVSFDNMDHSAAIEACVRGAAALPRRARAGTPAMTAHGGMR